VNIIQEESLYPGREGDKAKGEVSKPGEEEDKSEREVAKPGGEEDKPGGGVDKSVVIFLLINLFGWYLNILE
jgi:hypothetical protein